jgi:hypothetical protein
MSRETIPGHALYGKITAEKLENGEGTIKIVAFLLIILFPTHKLALQIEKIPPMPPLLIYHPNSTYNSSHH